MVWVLFLVSDCQVSIVALRHSRDGLILSEFPRLLNSAREKIRKWVNGKKCSVVIVAVFRVIEEFIHDEELVSGIGAWGRDR